MMKKKNLNFLNIEMQAICMDGPWEKLPVRGFKWVRNVSRIDEDFIKNYDDDGDVGFFS